MQRNLLLALLLGLGSGFCAFTVSAQDEQAEILDRDPWEGFNRVVFSFNDGLDRYTLKPIAKGYRYITPDVVETGVSNIYSNLLEVRNILNDVLQWKWGRASHDSGRLLLNSTVGLAGIFDVAEPLGLPRSDGEDFGQTLAVWGVEQGPYVMLPFLGPSTLRDGAALPVDWAAGPVGYIKHVPTRNTAVGMGLLSTRANLLKLDVFMAGDRYALLRDAYLQRRVYLIGDGVVEDDFGMDAYGEGY